MDSRNVTKNIPAGQAALQYEDLTDSDRRLLVKSSLSLFLRRLNHGIPVRRSDLLQVAYYAPEEAEAA